MRIGIFGTGQTARQVISILEYQGEGVASQIQLFDDDEDLHGGTFEGLPVAGGRAALLASGVDGVVVAVGQVPAKREVAEWMDENQVPQTSAIHPTVHVPSRSSIGAGSIICSGVTFSTNPQIGRYVFIGPGAVISHDTVVGDYSLISVGATVGARVDIEAAVFVGAGSTVQPTGWGGSSRLTLGEGSTIGVGAVAIKDVDAGDTVVGVPAKSVRRDV